MPPKQSKPEQVKSLEATLWEAADRLNRELDDSRKLRLLGNFDATRGYIGFALATSDETLAHGLDIPPIHQLK